MGMKHCFHILLVAIFGLTVCPSVQAAEVRNPCKSADGVKNEFLEWETPYTLPSQTFRPLEPILFRAVSSMEDMGELQWFLDGIELQTSASQELCFTPQRAG